MPQISKRRKRRFSQLGRIARRDGSCCVWCGYELTPMHPYATIEHIIPRDKGGADDETNYLLACRDCNSHRGSEDALAWVEACQAKGLAPNVEAVEAALVRLEQRELVAA